MIRVGAALVALGSMSAMIAAWHRVWLERLAGLKKHVLIPLYSEGLIEFARRASSTGPRHQFPLFTCRLYGVGRAGRASRLSEGGDFDQRLLLRALSWPYWNSARI
jgi:hypothetical protein